MAQLINKLSSLEAVHTHAYGQKVVEGIDITINFFTEIEDKELFKKLMLTDLNNIIKLDPTYLVLREDIANEIGENYLSQFESFVSDFAGALHFLKIRQNVRPFQVLKSISRVFHLWKYVSERRRYFVTFLTLIPQFSKGSEKLSEFELFEFEIFHIEAFMVQITTGRDILLMQSCYDDFELIDNGGIITWNKEFNPLDTFSLEPQRLTLIDQLELRPDTTSFIASKKPSNQMFSVLELDDTLDFYERIFSKYNVNKISSFIELKALVPILKKYVADDYRIAIPVHEFQQIQQNFPFLKLSIESNNYFEHLNSFAPFSSFGEIYYSNVMLVVRLMVNTLQSKLESNKRFQVNSGFIFEDRIVEILKDHGFQMTGITRINRKEFDVVTTRDGRIHNFQCKNNFFEISVVDLDYQKTARLNNKLCTYYESAYNKEVQRENLLKNKLGINKITHYVVSRFPVLTNQEYVINFNFLEGWLKQNFQ